MSRAFWFSLLVGYLAGAFAAAIYLPRAILAPSLSNLILLTLFSALFVIVVSWRAWRGRDTSLPAWPWQMPAPSIRQNAGHTTAAGEIGDERELLLHSGVIAEPAPRNHHSPLPRHAPQPVPEHLTEHEMDQLGQEFAQRLGRVANQPPAERWPQEHPPPHRRARVSIDEAAAQPRLAKSPRGSRRQTTDLTCRGESLVTMPQRRPVGRHIVATLSQNGRDYDRRSLIEKGVDQASLLDFDLAVVNRMTEWFEDGLDPRSIGARLIVDLPVAALRSRKSRQVIDSLRQATSDVGIVLALALDGFEGKKLPQLNPDTIGDNVEFHLRSDGVPPGGALERGFAGIIIDRADLEPYLGLPLDADPVNERLAELTEQGGSVIFDHITSEAALRDVLDYPCQLATGPVFGGMLEPDGVALANPAVDDPTTYDRLRASTGYGLAGATGFEA